MSANYTKSTILYLMTIILNIIFFLIIEPVTSIHNNKISTVLLFHSFWVSISFSKMCTNIHYNRSLYCVMILYNKLFSHISQILISNTNNSVIICWIAPRIIFLVSVNMLFCFRAHEQDNQCFKSKLHWIQTACK